MQALVYYISLPFIYLVSVLPFWLLYRVSDLLYIVLYYFIGYRRKVVMSNLKNSFPEKSLAQLKQIEKEFYKFLCDLMLETLKTLTISKKQAVKRCYFDNIEFFNPFLEKNQKIILVLGHYGNWELGGAGITSQKNINLHVLYKPLSNKYFDKLIIKMRTRLGTKLIKMKETFRVILANRKNKQIETYAFIADQTPSPQNAYWTTFLNQDTPVFWGTEVIAKKLNYPVVYVTINRVKRGYYKMHATMLCENPKETSKGEISEMHTKKLEQDIINEPAIWLWSHKRWKHKRPNLTR